MGIEAFPASESSQNASSIQKREALDATERRRAEGNPSLGPALVSRTARLEPSEEGDEGKREGTHRGRQCSAPAASSEPGSPVHIGENGSEGEKGKKRLNAGGAAGTSG